jgi:uncharacterized protein YdbL (DUF1318 family)
MNGYAQSFLPIARRRLLQAVAAWFVFVMAAATVPPPVAAQTLESARASGEVGERYDGYLVARQANPSPAVAALVAQVNSQRRGIYERRAAEQRVPAPEVGRLYAQEIAQQAPRGTWFLLENGAWRQK